MFEKTHLNLTKYYATITITMLTFILICFLIAISYFYYSDEKKSITAFAFEEIDEHIYLLKDNEQENLISLHQKSKDNVYNDEKLNLEEIQNSLRMFSFIKLPDGTILPLTITTKNIENWVTMQITNHDLTQPKILTYKIKEPHNIRHKILFKQQEIIKDGKLLGTIYVGKDVSIMWSVLKKIALSSIFIVILFTVVLFYSGRLMAAKAMQPVKEAIIKQKRFVTDASHELKTPLSVILMGVEVIKNNDTDKKNEQVILDIQDEIRKMTKLVDQMLNLSKLDERETNLSTNTDVVKTAKMAVDNLVPLAKEKKINLQLENFQEIIWQINNDDLAQMIYILVENAIKYTAKAGNIVVFLQVKDEHLLINVEDTGIGIKKEEQSLIFERFYRVDEARDRQSEGSGLGLSILRSLVEKHQGTITIDSKIDKGSLFTIILPKTD